MKVLIVGAGRTAEAIAKELVKKREVSHLFVYSRTPKSSKALAYDLHSAKIKVIEDLKNARDTDFIIILLSAQSDSSRKNSVMRRFNTYQIRQDELAFNLGAIFDLTKDLKKIGEKSRIIVVTNPVDEITNYIRIVLNRSDVIGFGLDMDAKRYSGLLKKSVLCVGLHGKSIPISNLRSVDEYNILSSKIDKKLLKYIKEFGIPYSVAGSVFSEFFDKITSKNKSIVHMCYFFDKPFFGVKSVSISAPFCIQDGKVLYPARLSMTETEKKLFLKCFETINRSIRRIMLIHKNLKSGIK